MICTRLWAGLYAGALLTAAAAAVAADNKPVSSQALKTYLYVQAINASGASSVVQFEQNADGTLQSLTPPAVRTGAFPYSLAVDPAGNNLYAALWVSPGAVQEFKIQHNGTLAGSASTAIAHTGSEPYPLVFTPDGAMAVAPNNADGTISAYRVGANGALTLVNTVPTGPESRSVVVSPSGAYAYAANYTGNTISRYTIGPSGLTADGMFPTGSFPYTIVISPGGKYLYSANRGGGSITEFAIDRSSGSLQRIGAILSGSGRDSGVNWICFDPTGRFAYVTNGAEGTVTQFTVNAATGLLSLNGGSVPVGAAPVQAGVDPSGRFVYVANSGANSVSQLIIKPDGTLSEGETMVIAGKTHVVGGMFPLPASPWTIAFAQR